MMPPLEWKFDEEHRAWYTDVPVKNFNDHKSWRIIAYPRPNYCDRGKWLVMVGLTENINIGPLDDQEGFPRFYFKLENMKDEMQAWVEDRQDCKDAYEAGLWALAGIEQPR